MGAVTQKTNKHMYMYMNMCMCTCMCAWMCMCIYIYIYICVCVCLCISVCVCVCICICVYIYIYIYIYRSLKFLQRRLWRELYSVMWRRTVWYMFTDISKDPAASIISQWWIDDYYSPSRLSWHQVSLKRRCVPTRIHGLTLYSHLQNHVQLLF